MKNISCIDLHAVTLALGSACLTFALTGCGGTAPEDYSAQFEGMETTQTGQNAASKPPVYSGTASQAGTAIYRADTSSFTLNPTEQFSGFNSDSWNGNKAWYECDCGDTPRGAPDTMPWNPGG